MDKWCLIVSYYFPPVGGAGVQRILKMIKYLSRHQWKFTVISAVGDDELQPIDPTLMDEIPDQIITKKISLMNDKMTNMYNKSKIVDTG